MKSKIRCITVMSHVNPQISKTPFVSVFFGRDGEDSNSSMTDPTPSSMKRIMRWQAATVLAAKKAQS